MYYNPRLAAVKLIARNAYAWPGGYPVGLLMDDGEILCHKCTKGNYRLILTSTRDLDHDGWTAAGHMIYEGTEEDHGRVECCNCGAVLVGEGAR